MQPKKLIVILSAILVVLLAAAIIITNVFSADIQKGNKTITVTVVYEGEAKDHKINTNAEFLGQAMFEANLIEEDEYKSGYYTIIDGKKADWDKNEAWWCVFVDGQMADCGMNDLPIKDGDSFEIKYTLG